MEAIYIPLNDINFNFSLCGSAWVGTHVAQFDLTLNTEASLNSDVLLGKVSTSFPTTHNSGKQKTHTFAKSS